MTFFLIWTHRKESLEKFHLDFNNFLMNISLSLEQSTQQVIFLDTTVELQHGHLNTTLFRKPTNQYTCMALQYSIRGTSGALSGSKKLKSGHVCAVFPSFLKQYSVLLPASSLHSFLPSNLSGVPTLCKHNTHTNTFLQSQ